MDASIPFLTFAVLLFHFSSMLLPSVSRASRPHLKTKKSMSVPNKERTPHFDMNFKVEKYKLENGLTVLLHEDQQAPLVNYQTWFRAGSKDDPPQRTGMAHLFEHLMFRGTNKRKGSDFVKDIESRGISFNAYTSFDKTVYYFNLPREELNFIAELEAERMHDLALTKENLRLEKEIVKEERLMRYKNNPQNLWTDIFELAFNVNNYRWPVIGYPKDIDQTSPDDCKNFYGKFYAPNNAVIVIAGPINLKETKQILQTHYSPLPASPLKDLSYPDEPPQNKQRVQTLYRKVQAPSLALAYHAPPAGAKTAYALDILSFILGGGKSSRLYQLLVEKTQSSVSVQALNMSLKYKGLFIILSSLHPQKNVSSIYKMITDEIKKLTQSPIQPEELARAKTNVVKSHVDVLKTAEGKASMLGTYEFLFNDYSHLFGELERYNQVTAQDILKAAQTFLNISQQSWIQLHPKQ